jgi:protein-S-isoprenylcysteine O-methyltransferase Ste14
MTTTALIILTRVGWGLLELGLRVRDRARGKGSTHEDRGTRALSGGLLIAAVAVALVLEVVTGDHSPLRIPGRPDIAGLAIMWLGLVVRVWAVATLGRSFRTTVEVDVGQAVISRGPYRLVRHPSYTGLLLIMAGFGLTAGNWLALGTCVVLPVVGLLWRIQVEEAELTRVLGDPYRIYRERTKRLIPGVW